jgi:hypothetical protein
MTIVIPICLKVLIKKASTPVNIQNRLDISILTTGSNDIAPIYIQTGNETSFPPPVCKCMV